MAAFAVLLAAASPRALGQVAAEPPPPAGVAEPGAAEPRVAWSVHYGALPPGHLHIDDVEQKFGTGNAWRFALACRVAPRLAIGAFFLSARAPLAEVDRRMSMDAYGLELVAHAGRGDRPHLRLGATFAYQRESFPGVLPTIGRPVHDEADGFGVGGFAEYAIPAGSVAVLAHAGFVSQLAGSSPPNPLVRWTPLLHVGIGVEYAR